MLNWLAGHRPSDNGFDIDTTAITEGPETPAPVFAVRAFKHAIFGTPQTQQISKQRRHSATENPQPRPVDTRLPRPTMTRPKSWHDAQAFNQSEVSVVPDPLPSPTKGILMTPGTTGARRKTVSFGVHVVDNEAKRQAKSGLPDEYPGKFPSPWSKSVADPSNGEDSETVERLKGRNKFTEALEQVRDDSTKRKPKPGRPIKTPNDLVNGNDIPETQSEPMKNWKQEYDIYRENTTREVKKLVAKQKAAKNFARDKDLECSELKEELRLEQKKVLLLEKRAKDLEAQMKELQDQLAKSQAEEQMAKQELRLRAQNSNSETAQPTFAEQIDAARNERKERRPILRPRSAIPQTCSDVQPVRLTEGTLAKSQEESDQDQIDSKGARTRARHIVDDSREIRDIPPISGSDTAKTRPSSRGKLTATKPSARQPKGPQVDFAPQDTRSIAMSMGLQPPSPVRDTRRDSPLDSPELHRPNSNDPPIKPSEQTLESPKFNPSEPSPSSPFLPEPDSDPFMSTTTTTRPKSPIARASDLKENIAPVVESSKAEPKIDHPHRPLRKEITSKPSAIWNELGSGRTQSTMTTASGVAGKRMMMGKDGQEVGADRIAAARARILARGRQIS